MAFPVTGGIQMSFPVSDTHKSENTISLGSLPSFNLEVLLSNMKEGYVKNELGSQCAGK